MKTTTTLYPKDGYPCKGFGPYRGNVFGCIFALSEAQIEWLKRLGR